MKDWVPPPVDSRCYPRGFLVAGSTCGIKASGKPDLAMIASETQCRFSAMYTPSRFAAPPVTVSKRHGKNGIRAIVVSSGNANACTGEQGERDALAMCDSTANALGARTDEVLVCSTGLIGRPMPMDKITQGIPRIAQVLSPDAWVEAADAIRTTDAFRKMSGRCIEIDGEEVRLIGIAKGAGMIHPNMATMIALLATDAEVEPSLLQTIVHAAVRDSFNSCSVDGDMSTNDTLVLMANGCSGAEAILEGTEAADRFASAVREVCIDLAKMMVRDGEGSTRLATIEVTGAVSEDEARRAARTVANSVLVKMAILGGDPNWGRIVAALGYAEVDVRPESCSVGFDGIKVLNKGVIADPDQVALDAALKKSEFTIEIDLGTEGSGRATFWTCDISEEYLRFNADYRT